MKKNIFSQWRDSILSNAKYVLNEMEIKRKFFQKKKIFQVLVKKLKSSDI